MKPKQLRIGTTFYDIRYSKKVICEEGELLGDIDLNSLIRIDSSVPHSKQLHTLFHEVTHGISEEMYLNLNEQKTTLIANAYYNFIIDNPDYIKEILKSFENK